MPPCHTSFMRVTGESGAAADAAVRHSVYPLYRSPSSFSAERRESGALSGVTLTRLLCLLMIGYEFSQMLDDEVCIGFPLLDLLRPELSDDPRDHNRGQANGSCPLEF